MMAAAVFASTGRMAVALGEMGPGGLNLASGAGVAFNNNLAALFITTNQHRAASYPHVGMFMDMDTRAVFAPLTKWNAVVNDAPHLNWCAPREALSGRPGPVHLDIPRTLAPRRFPTTSSRCTGALAGTRRARRPFGGPRGGPAARARRRWWRAAW
jgi:thiamine pyrophosphate-dependent acetolactate synthase large subunit-like protein